MENNVKIRSIYLYFTNTHIIVYDSNNEKIFFENTIYYILYLKYISEIIF